MLRKRRGGTSTHHKRLGQRVVLAGLVLSVAVLVGELEEAERVGGVGGPVAWFPLGVWRVGVTHPGAIAGLGVANVDCLAHRRQHAV